MLITKVSPKFREVQVKQATSSEYIITRQDADGRYVLFQGYVNAGDIEWYSI
jgi:hypothetical protein